MTAANDYFDWGSAARFARFDTVRSGDANAALDLATAGFNKLPSLVQLWGASVNYAADTGVADAYAITLSSNLVAYTDGMSVRFKAANASATTAPTLNVNNMGAKVIGDAAGGAIAAGSIAAGSIVTASYSASTGKFHMIGVGLQGPIGPPGVVSIKRSPRTANAMLVAADSQWLIDITSGTFSQTFDAAATLGSGWFCFIKNSGTGTITLDPNAAETIDGATTLTLGPGASVLVQCTGTALSTVQSERAASGSSLTLLVPPITPTAAANINALTVCTALYDNYLIIGRGMSTGSADELRLRLANAGVVDSAGNYAYSGRLQPHTGTGNDTGANAGSSLPFGTDGNGIATGTHTSFVLTLHNVNSAGYKQGFLEHAWKGNDGTFRSCRAAMTYLGPAVSGFQLYLAGGGNFGPTGSLTIYGYNNA